MKSIFNKNNKVHMQILAEELNRAKKILKEGYSADMVWEKIPEDDRWELIAATTDDEGPDLADKYCTAVWDNIPADIQDQLDLSDYGLANIPGQHGNMSGLRAIKKFSSEDANVKKLVDAYLKKVNRAVDDLTVKQSYELQTMIGKLKQQTSTSTSNPSINLNPRDFGGGPSTNPFNKGYTGD